MAEQCTEVSAEELEPGDVLLGMRGGRSVVDNVEWSSTQPGFMLVETEHGALYYPAGMMVPVIR